MKKMKWTPERIKALRKALDETLDVFAKRFEITAGAVHLWEKAKRIPSGLACRELDRIEAEFKKLQPA